MKNSRKIFLETITELAEKDPMVIFCYCDVGFSFVEEFKEKFPKQWINLGAAEQSAIGVVAGLANQGLKPYFYTMKNFILLRPIEQVRNDIAFANANVKLLGVGGSEAYKFLGVSHNLYPGEEEGMLKFMENITSYLEPQSEESLRENLLKEYERIGPAYFAI